MRKGIREQLKNQNLPEDDLSDDEQQLLRQMLDRQLAKEWTEELKKQGIHRIPPMKPLRSRLLPWAAVAAFLLFGAFGWWWLTQPPVPQKMAVQYLEQPFSWSESIRDGNGNINQQRARSQQAYQNGDYKAALNDIAPLIPEGRKEDLLLAGLCHQNLSQYTEAISLLEKARAADPSFYRDEINWYIGLNYVMLHDNENARLALQRVADSNSSRNKQAAIEMLEKLR